MGNCLASSSVDAFDDGTKVKQTTEFKSLKVHQGILKETEGDFHKKYIELEVLGQGAMGAVSRVQVREDFSSSLRTSQPPSSSNSSDHHHSIKHTDFALKHIRLDNMIEQESEAQKEALEGLENEIAILQSMDHPNILKAHEVYSVDSKKEIYLILELCGGGNLYSRFPYTEPQVNSIIQQLCSAVQYMHDHAIVHRDCK